MRFDGAILLGSAKIELRLDTRQGNPIPNVVIPPPEQEEFRKAGLFVTLHGRDWAPRKPHLAVYNCAGHVWASRRTAILDEDAVRMILEDDNYRVLRENEGVAPGDLVLYWGKAGADAETFLHVGMICEIRAALGSVRIPWVLSKWGSTIGEYLHRWDDVPYTKFGYTLRIEIRTDRL
jgi:hypothetical protein